MTEWRKHTGTEMPSELAAAQIVELMLSSGAIFSFECRLVDWDKVDVIYYRPALTKDGLPYVSAEGLSPWAEYVAKDDDAAWQYRCKPRYTDSPFEDGTFFWTDDVFEVMTEAPSTHAIPGDPANSLAKVWREW